MTPVWSPEAIDDLAALRAYIEQDDPAAAQRVAIHVIRSVDRRLRSRLSQRSFDRLRFVLNDQ